MQKVKQLFLQNLLEITNNLEYSTDKSSELALLILLFLFGEKSINASPLSSSRKRHLYKTLRELKDGAELKSVYRFFQKTVLPKVIPLLKIHGQLSRSTRQHRKQFILSVWLFQKFRTPIPGSFGHLARPCSGSVSLSQSVRESDLIFDLSH